MLGFNGGASVESSTRLPLLPWFPNLNSTNHAITSESSTIYNCIAWAAEIVEKWWWPIRGPDEEEVHWPVGISRELTIDAFVAAFGTIGYERCTSSDHEAGYDRIALFTRNGEPTHAARQLADKLWTSKLGISEDITHELNALDGLLYGTATVFMRRPMLRSIAGDNENSRAKS